MTTTDPFNRVDRQAMGMALGLARRGLGRVAPNPAVGCVLLRPDQDPETGGRIVGRGWTQPGGRPHAETEAIKQAGDHARGATAYVTLEPCCHQGETGPCTEALIQAGVTRVVAAMEDPDQRVSGKGLAALRSAGIQVQSGLMADAAADLNKGFVLRVTQGRPEVTLKTATSQDGFIAPAVAGGKGSPVWITGEAARERGHLMRAEHDAILVGSGTVLSDDPELTCRLPGMADRSPVRVVLASGIHPLYHKKISNVAMAPTWITTPHDQAKINAQVLFFVDSGATVLSVEFGNDGRPEPRAVLQKLAEEGINRLLIEGGSKVARSFFDAGLVDRVAWFRAPKPLGAGVPAVDGADLSDVLEDQGFVLEQREQVGVDTLEMFRAEPAPRIKSGP